MRHANELDAENADVHYVARLDAMNQSVANQVVFFEFAFRQAGGEMRTVNGNVELLQQVRQRAEMIFVSVRQHDGGDVVAILVEKVEVRNGNIDAVRGLLRKAHAGVENQHLVAVTHRHAVHSKLTDTTERNDLK